MRRLGKYGPFPGAKGRVVRKILQHYCGDPIRNSQGRKAGKGSHLKFKSPRTDSMITFSYKDSDDIQSGILKKMLIKQLGLTEEEAREELK